MKLSGSFLSNLWLPAALMVMLTTSAVWSRPLLPPDETRYLSVAWEMSVTGDYLVSHLNGATYAHKPPLLFWLINAIWTFFGVQETAARLVAPTAALTSVLLTGLIARRLWPERPTIAAIAPLIHCSLLLWVLFSPLTMFDSLLTVCVQTALLGVLRLDSGRFRSGIIMTGVGIGLGVLTKGPVILVHVLPAALLSPLWSNTARQHLVRWYASVFAATGIGVLIGLSWAIPSAMSGGPEYANELLWGQTAGRMVNSFAHREPFWWYLPILPLICSPWILLPPVWSGFRTLLGSLRNTESAAHASDNDNTASISHSPQDRQSEIPAFRRIPEPSARFCIVWGLGSIVVMSAVSGKQAYYLVPAVPSFALVLALLLSTASKVSRSEFRLIAAGTMLGGILPVVLNHVPGMEFTNLVDVCPTWSAIPFCLCGTVLMLKAEWPVVSAARWLATAAVAYITVLVCVLSPTLWPQFDLKPLADHVHRLQNSETSVAWLGAYHGRLHFMGRLTEPVTEIMTDEEFQDWLNTNPDGRLVYPISRRETNTPLPMTADTAREMVSKLNRTLKLPPGFEVADIDFAMEIRRGLTRGLLIVVRFSRTL